MSVPQVVVLTCASGKQASYLIPLLYSNSLYKLRLVVHSQSSHESLASKYPNAEVRRADLVQVNDCRDILRNANVVFHVGPPFHIRESAIGLNMIEAALAESQSPSSVFKHFIYSSVLTPQISKLLNHDCKRIVEEALIESGLNFTILQPSHFVDPSMDRIIASRDEDPVVYKAWFDPDVKFSFLALEDFAEVAKKIIEAGQSHYFAIYPLVSTVPRSYRDLVRDASEVLCKEIKIEQWGYTEITQTVTKMMLGEDAIQWQKDGPERLLLYYNSRGLVGNPSVCEMLLDRKAVDLKVLFKRKLELAQT